MDLPGAVTCRGVTLTFLGCYVLFVVAMVIYLTRSPGAMETTHNWVLPREEVEGRKVFYPRKPEQSQDTPCFHTLQPFIKPTFHQILPTVYLVNAFYIVGTAGASSEIRILALLEGDAPPATPIYCLFHGGEETPLTSVQGKFTALQSENDNKYQVYFLTCALQQPVSRDDMCHVYVSTQPALRHHKDYVTLPLLPIEKKHYPFSFALCVPPIHGVVSQTRLIEFIEMNSILGADHFIFYRYQGDQASNYSNPNIDQVLDYYERVGLATVHPWRLPVPADSVWHHGWKLAMHHCLLTSTWNYKYLLFTDIDEYLVPRGQLGLWSDLMEKIEDDKHSGYCFYSTFFPPEPGDPFVTMASLQRALVVNSQHMKCMVRPERVMEMGNCDVITQSDAINRTLRGDVVQWTRDDVSTMEVDEALALIHHYRNCDQSIQGNCHDMVKDDVMVKFKDNLHSNHKTVMKYLMSGSKDER